MVGFVAGTAGFSVIRMYGQWNMWQSPSAFTQIADDCIETRRQTCELLSRGMPPLQPSGSRHTYLATIQRVADRDCCDLRKAQKPLQRRFPSARKRYGPPALRPPYRSESVAHVLRTVPGALEHTKLSVDVTDDELVVLGWREAGTD